MLNGKTILKDQEGIASPAKDLTSAYTELKRFTPGLRARDAARALGVSEGELVSSRVGNGVTRLSGAFADVLRALPSIGRVMVLTRNEHCVHEKYGVFDHVSIGPGHGMVLNGDIDLRLFLDHWRFGFSVTEEVASGLRTSLQFFDIDGSAVHKVYLTDKSDREAYDALVLRFRDQEQSSTIETAPLPRSPKNRPDAKIDTATFQKHWRALQDTHEFFGLLQEFGLRREQAMRLAEPEFAYRVAPEALRSMLEAASETHTPVMCFVGNPGCIQIHTGPIKTLKATGPWFNILDDGFNLHLREDAIANIWVVKKPTADGVVTSLEIFDADGFCFVQFFGERKPGKPELQAWRNIVAALPKAVDESRRRS